MVEEFEIKIATISDMKAVFDLSNDELVRANSFNQEKICWEDHQIWFKSKLDDFKKSIFYVIKSNDENLVGYVRLDNENDNWIITIHLSKMYRGKGFGKKIIEAVCNLNEDKNIIAFVKETNIASYQSFINAGFNTVELVKKENENFYKLEI